MTILPIATVNAMPSRMPRVACAYMSLGSTFSFWCRFTWKDVCPIFGGALGVAAGPLDMTLRVAESGGWL